MMTLEEAITHCEEVGRKNLDCGNEKCGNEHLQLAEWLKELQGYRDERSNNADRETVL
jgi:hypothetical protein